MKVILKLFLTKEVIKMKYAKWYEFITILMFIFVFTITVKYFDETIPKVTQNTYGR